MPLPPKPGDTIDVYSLPDQPGVYSFTAPSEVGGYRIRLIDPEPEGLVLEPRTENGYCYRARVAGSPQPDWLVELVEYLLASAAIRALEEAPVSAELWSACLQICQDYDRHWDGRRAR